MAHLWIAVEFGTTVVMGFVIGMYIDGRTGHRPWGALIGFVAGLALGAMSVAKSMEKLQVKRYTRGNRKGRRRPK